MTKPLQVFCCYARNDQEYLYELKKHLMVLQREQLIEIKADINISPGTEWEREISHHLNEANIILLLISADFIASDYCFEKEMQQAIARHERGTACVLPVIIRPTSWESMPFSKLQALPKDAKPVSVWQNRDEAWANITEGIREVVNSVKRLPDETGQSVATPLFPMGSLFDIPELPVPSVDRPVPPRLLSPSGLAARKARRKWWVRALIAVCLVTLLVTLGLLGANTYQNHLSVVNTTATAEKANNLYPSYMEGSGTLALLDPLQEVRQESTKILQTSSRRSF